MREINLTLSTSEINNPGQIVIRQDDKNTQRLIANITENGQGKNLYGLTPYFNAMVKGGIVARDLAEITGKSQVSYTLKDGFYQKTGMIEGFFSFERNGNRESTANFPYHVIQGACRVFRQGSYIYEFEKALSESIELVENNQAAWDEFFGEVREILESVDPGGKLLLKVTDLEKEFKKVNEGTLLSVPFNKTFKNLADRLNYVEQFVYDYVPNEFKFIINHTSEYPAELSITTYKDALDFEVGGLGTSNNFGGGTITEIPHHLAHDRKKVTITMPSKYYSKGTIIQPIKNVFLIAEGNKVTKFELKNASGTSASYA